MTNYLEEAENRYEEADSIEAKENLLKSLKEMLADLSEHNFEQMEEEDFEEHTYEVSQLQKLAGKIKTEIKYENARDRGDEEKLGEAMRNAQQAFWDTLDGKVDEPKDFNLEITGYLKNYSMGRGEVKEWKLTIPKKESKVKTTGVLE